MAFKASKTRQRRKPEAAGVGTPLNPSAAIRVWYKREMMSIVIPMIEDYRKEITAAMESPEVHEHFAQDAAANGLFHFVLRKLNKKWKDIFNGFAAQLAPKFVDKVDTHTKATTFFSLSTAGVNQPRQVYNENVSNTLNAAIDFNHTLITRIQEDVHEKLYNSIMLSVTSPNPEEQGSSGIANALREVGITSKKRVDLIARDQTSKINASMSTERLKQAGVEYFRWLHSSAGKVPRITHVEKNDEVFHVDDPRLWQGPKADQGPPGWAINCRCRAVPLIGYNPEDDDENM
jgi:SPP1 gp7 family putative phage head morphogenesis protein